jgi:2,4-dienoyl-CoA reductase-like NADH-dependent reductase (Old Yellow Enzyme family)/thioredoxin reductase
MKENHADYQGLTRRHFLEGAAVTALGASVAATGMLNGCIPNTNTEDDSSGNQTSSDGATASKREFNPQDYDYRDNTTDFTTLFSELKVGPFNLSHRIIKPAAGSDTQNNPTEMIAYHQNFAKGGVELIWMEDCADMYPNFPLSRKQSVNNIPFSEIAAAVHAEGASIGYQLSTMGIVFSGTREIAPGSFASAIAGDLTMDELKTLQADTTKAAQFLQGEGFDGIEINAAGNNLPQSFLSRARNKRTDEYGPQTFENRTRFIVELIQDIKQACGQNFAVQVLINGIEENDNLLGDNSLFTTVEENIEICKLFEAAGADSLHLRLGPINMHICQFASDLYFTGFGISGTTGFGNQFDFSRHWQGKLLATHSGCGMMLDVAKEVKEAVSIPVGTVTYMDPAHAPDYFEAALRDGKTDFLMINRPLTVDSEYVNKLKEKRIDEIAPCTRCLHCHFDYDQEGKIYEHCRVNAMTQRAFREQMPEGFELPAKNGDKRIMVVGAGPAGMEAARIAAMRGYDVTIYEKSGSVGGLLEFANMVKGPHENLLDLRSYLEKQLSLTGVTVMLNTEVTADLINSEAPDAVIFAIGGLRNSLDLSETAGTKIVPISDFLSSDIGETITVVGANAQAIDTVLCLLAQGKNVTMVFSDPIEKADKSQSNWVKTFVMPMIYAQGTRVWPNAKIVAVGNGEITISCETGVNMTFKCDTVIEAMDMLPNTSMLDSVPNIESYAVGDCKTPWNIADAIAAGNITARNI